MSEPNASLPSADFLSPELLLSAIVDSSDDAIISKNLKGIITSWNKAAVRIFGYEAAEVIGQSIMLLLPLERRAEETLIMDHIKKGERIDHLETQRLRKDGAIIEVSVTISPIKNAEGIIIGASKIARDITAQKLSASQLHRQQEKMNRVNSIGTALSGQLDLEKLVQSVTDVGRELSGAAFGAFFYTISNDQGERFTLYTLSGAPREAFERFGTPRNTPIFAPTFSGEGVVRVDDITKDPRYGQMAPHHGMPAGHLPVRSYLAVPVKSRSGEVLGGLFFGHPQPGIFSAESEELLLVIAAQAGVAIDNAQLYAALERELERQKQLEKALRASEALSSSILNSTGDCITVLQRDGRLLSMNDSGMTQFGIRKSSPIEGSLWSSLWPSQMQTEVDKALATARAGGIGRFQSPGKTNTQEDKWWDVIVSPLSNEREESQKLTATARDITELRKAEEETQLARAEAERQSRIKDEFLATLSHELRTPLQSILGWTQILRSAESTAQDLQQGLETIDRNAQAQTRIIEDLLDMNRILSGKVRLDVQRLSLSAVIEEALETVKPAAQAKGIRLQSILDPLAKPITGDPGRLQQILWNLLTNAIKFTPSGGRIQTSLERVNSHLEVNIADNGEGISPDFLPYVFERFRQADGSPTRRHGGLGLGLAIVKHLTELHGGQVRVKSIGKGMGTTFTLILPLAPVQIEAEPEMRRHPQGRIMATVKTPLPNIDGIRILLVDDEADSRTLLARILRGAGGMVETAASALEALEKIRKQVPDMLISDIGMPEMDGLSLIRAVRALPSQNGGALPALALTAYTRVEDRVQALTAGFQMHLSKPADSLELLTVVKSLSMKLD